MDIATIIGIIGGLGLIFGSIILGGSLAAFIDVPSLLIVGGGTIMATLIMQQLNVVMGAINIAMKAFFNKTDPPEKIIKEILGLSLKVRKDGILALEKVKVQNRILSRGVRLAVDGIGIDEIIDTLKIDVISTVRRHETGHKVFRFMGATAPAMGMIGTLIGLVQMLKSMSDPSSIGPAMAVALLTTFYGAVLAFVIFNPIAENLAIKTAEEKIVADIVMAGIEGILKGLNPSILEDKLFSFLSPKLRKKR